MRSYDDGSFFVATMQLPGGALSLTCGERSPRGLSALETGNMEPTVTPRDALRLRLDLDALPLPGGFRQSRDDLIVEAGGQGFRLPPLNADELTWSWSVDLGAADPLFAAIPAAPEMVLHGEAGRLALPTAGFAEAHGQLRRHCAQMFATVGQPWATAAPATPSAPVTPRAEAEAALARGCNGPADAGPAAFLAGEIDGDGQPDIVLDWREITCRSGHPRPFCGASMCQASVFLSSRPGTPREPLELLALGVRLQPLSNGNMAVAVGGSLSMCQPQGTACEFLYYWTGSELAELR